MARALRLAKYDPYGTYHIMNRGSSDTIILKTDADKEKFLKILKKAQKIYNFTLYSYCLMDTHFHLLIYSNGSNISDYMKYIQQCFAMYYNRIYARRGHVFADRFKSVPAIDKPNSTTSSAELSISAYIHSNPKDVIGYHGRMEKYQYCSFGVYMGLRRDKLGILDIDYILSFFHKSDKGKAKQKYKKFVYGMHNMDMKEDTEFKSEPWIYKSGKSLIVKNFAPQQVFDFVSEYIGKKGIPYIKYNRKNLNYKSICVILMRSICGFKLSDICSILGNITSSNVWKLCDNGISIITKNYKNIIDDFISYTKSSSLSV
jgi:REP element-mobilizing transposase RayT